MKRGRAALSATLLFIGICAGAGASPVSAADQPSGIERFAKAQAGRSFVVYAPTVTFGLPRSSFQSVPCGGTRGSALSVDYGSQGSGGSKWIGLQESPGKAGCVDGPDGLARKPIATFTINGAEVSIAGRCPDSAEDSGCRKSSPALLLKGGYTTVTLPGSAARPTTTYVEIYSQQLSVAQIRAFVRGLVPAT